MYRVWWPTFNCYQTAPKCTKSHTEFQNFSGGDTSGPPSAGGFTPRPRPRLGNWKGGNPRSNMLTKIPTVMQTQKSTRSLRQASWRTPPLDTCMWAHTNTDGQVENIMPPLSGGIAFTEWKDAAHCYRCYMICWQTERPEFILLTLTLGGIPFPSLLFPSLLPSVPLRSRPPLRLGSLGERISYPSGSGWCHKFAPFWLLNDE